jgi:hypothetical protein
MSMLIERIQLLLAIEPNPGMHYYALTILLGDRREPEFSCFTGWVGFTEESPRREIRKASLVHADRMLKGWRKLGEPGMVVNTADDFSLFFAFGGHAVVEQTLAESVVPEWLAPAVSVHVGEFGFASPEMLPPGAMQRAPTPKHRMRIIQRDNYRCRVCGRSPNDHVDLELHVHHVRPWAVGGVTEDGNLITLCHTCHNGLDPHFEFALFKLLPTKEVTDRTASYTRRLQEYQAAVAACSAGSDE